jgi:hypothetical protein
MVEREDQAGRVVTRVAGELANVQTLQALARYVQEFLDKESPFARAAHPAVLNLFIVSHVEGGAIPLPSSAWLAETVMGKLYIRAGFGRNLRLQISGRALILLSERDQLQQKAQPQSPEESSGRGGTS